MMKEICAQCLQVQGQGVGRRDRRLSCFNQDQAMDEVDFANLRGWLANGVQRD
jgi:hypothetical protein